MSLWVVLPIVIPFALAALQITRWRHWLVQRRIGIVGTALHWVACIVLFAMVQKDGPIRVQMGNWPAPNGIAFVADPLSTLFVLVAATIAFAVSVYAWAGLDTRRESFGYHPLCQALHMGVCGAFLTADLFNLYVWFEVLLMASFVLIALGGERRQIAGAMKYVAINLISSSLFLAGAGLLYGMVGSLDMLHVAQVLATTEKPEQLAPVALLMIAAFGIKAAIFPSLFWVPDSYPAPPPAIGALCAGLLTKVGIYAILRVGSLVFPSVPIALSPAFSILGAITVLIGGLGSLAERDLKRIIAYQVMVASGTLLLGISIDSPLARQAVIAYVPQSMLSLTAMFFVAGVLQHLRSTSWPELALGEFAHRPWMAISLAFLGCNLAGVPPFAGFSAKLSLLQAAVVAEDWMTIIFVLVGSILTLATMARLIQKLVLQPSTLAAPPELETDADRAWNRWPVASTVALATSVLLMGVFASPVLNQAQDAAQTLILPSGQPNDSGGAS